MEKIRRNIPLYIRVTGLALILLIVHHSARADGFDRMRAKYFALLTGGDAADPSEPGTAAIIHAIDSMAMQQWASLDKGADRSCLWHDLTNGAAGSDVLSTLGRLDLLAVACRTRGCRLNGNTGLAADIISGVDWVYAHWYNEHLPVSGNWFEWEISAPSCLNDIMVLLYADLSPQQIAHYCAAIDARSGDPRKDIYATAASTGANRVWKCRVTLLRGIIAKNAEKINLARTALSPVFPYVTRSDGFYTDGSYIQHERYAYSGGYAVGLMEALYQVLALFSGSPWPVTDPNGMNVYKWVFDTFRPIVYKGGVLSMVAGREIARKVSEEHRNGAQLINSILLLSDAAPTTSIGPGYPPDPALAMKQLVKYWTAADTFLPYNPQSIYLHTRYLALKNDASIIPSGELIHHYRFPGMDRVVHLRPGYGIGLSMYSSRIYNYECINEENSRGWHTGDGMTYLYNNDLGQFSDDFWPTVDPYRLPGTTVVQHSETMPSMVSDESWVGGSDLDAGYGISGMRVHVGNLQGKKSWFFFDDEMVALGTGFTILEPRMVETIVENRKLTGTGDNALLVNGVAQPAGKGWSDTIGQVTWAHLAGNVPGSDIGYYFPVPVTLHASREERKARWHDISVYGDTALCHNTFLALWLDLGVRPMAGEYSYVLLPGKTSGEVSRYAKDPDIVILQNSPEIQAVEEKKLSVIGANFWTDTYQELSVQGIPAFISCNKKASVMVGESPAEKSGASGSGRGTGKVAGSVTGKTLEIAVSDPTQENRGAIEVTVKKSAGSVIRKDPRVTVLQMSPVIRLSVKTDQAGGKTIRVVLAEK